jgi:hypothetical protein
MCFGSNRFLKEKGGPRILEKYRRLAAISHGARYLCKETFPRENECSLKA